MGDTLHVLAGPPVNFDDYQPYQRELYETLVSNGVIDSKPLPDGVSMTCNVCGVKVSIGVRQQKILLELGYADESVVPMCLLDAVILQFVSPANVEVRDLSGLVTPEPEDGDRVGIIGAPLDPSAYDERRKAIWQEAVDRWGEPDLDSPHAEMACEVCGCRISVGMEELLNMNGMSSQAIHLFCTICVLDTVSTGDEGVDRFRAIYREKYLS